MKQAFAVNPAVCAPVMGRLIENIMEECKSIISKKPDIIEWRADFYEGIRDPEQLLESLRQLREVVGEIPILFTVRSADEGGNSNLNLSMSEKKDIYYAVCQSKLVNYVDFELAHSSDDIQQIRAYSKDNGIQLILSYHNFKLTPDEEFIRAKLLLMEQYECDIGKVAVMPNSLEDVLYFMQVTLSMQKQISIPLITMSMGELGVISRLAGWMFGSQLTFAIGENSSAPGQIPIHDVKTVIDIIKKSKL